MDGVEEIPTRSCTETTRPSCVRRTLRRDWPYQCHIGRGAGTGLTTATSLGPVIHAVVDLYRCHHGTATVINLTKTGVQR